jgi:hypothetical protein
MKTKMIVLFVGVLAFLPALVTAQGAQDEDLSRHPGFFDLDALDLLHEDDLEVEVNLTGPMMGLIASATQNEDPEFSAVVRGLERIRVRIGTPGAGESNLAQGLTQAAQELEAAGWSPMVRVRDGGDRVYVYAREVDERVQGMTVLVLDGDELALVNIVGELDLAALGRLISNMDGLEGLGSIWGEGD